MTAHVGLRFIPHVQLHVSDISAGLRLSSEGLNAPLPHRDPRLGSEGKLTLGVWLSAGPGLPSQQQTGRLGRQMQALRWSCQPLAWHSPGLPSPLEAPLWTPPTQGGPRAQLQPHHACLCQLSISTRLESSHLRPSAHDSIASHGPLSTQPPDTETRGPLSPSPPSHGQSASHPQRLLGPMLSLHAHHP